MRIYSHYYENIFSLQWEFSLVRACCNGVCTSLIMADFLCNNRILLATTISYD